VRWKRFDEPMTLNNLGNLDRAQNQMDRGRSISLGELKRIKMRD